MSGRRGIRRYRDGGAVTADVPPAGMATAASIDVVHDDKRDDASAAFQGQINALRHAEAIQKDRQRLAAKHGLTPNQAAFLEHNPSFPNHPEVAKRALMAAHEAGHAADSDEFHAHVHKAFHAEIGTNHSDHLVGRGGMRAPMPDDDEPEEPVKPKHRPKMDDDDIDTSRRFTSAPVSRGEGGLGSFGRGSGADRPGRITLSPQQVSMAKSLGMSVNDYAKGLMAMRDRDSENGR